MWHGTITALITPFRSDESFDAGAFERLIEAQIAAGVEGIVACGTTGESPTLTHGENIDIIERAVRIAAGRTNVIAGTGSNNTAEALFMTERAAAAGADAALLVVPYYNKPSQAGLIAHYRAIAEAVPQLPLILYDVPGRTGIRLAPETILELAQVPNIVALKDATGGLETLQAIIPMLPTGFTILAGDDNMTLPMMRQGATGVISVASNLLPARIKALVDAARAEDWPAAESLAAEFDELFGLCFLEANPIPIKSLLALRGVCEPVFRLPLCPPSAEHQRRLEDYLAKLG